MYFSIVSGRVQDMGYDVRKLAAQNIRTAPDGFDRSLGTAPSPNNVAISQLTRLRRPALVAKQRPHFVIDALKPSRVTPTSLFICISNSVRSQAGYAILNQPQDSTG